MGGWDFNGFSGQEQSGNSASAVTRERSMSMFRNIGSAVTFGSMETTKAREAREQYIERCAKHEERWKKYKEIVDEAEQKLESLWRQAQRGRELVVETGSLFADEEGRLRAGWYPLQKDHSSNPSAGGESTATPESSAVILAAIGVSSSTWATLGPLCTESTRAATIGLSGPAAGSFALTGFSALAKAQLLGVDFWKSRQRERERLDSIAQATEAIERREAEMQSHRSRLESILPEIAPAIDELASSAADAKTANDSRLATISEMRSKLAAHCARVAEALQETTSVIENARGNREELKAISERSRDVTTAAAELQTESNRQEAAVNEETNRTTAVLNKLAAAVETADEFISNSRVEGADTAASG